MNNMFRLLVILFFLQSTSVICFAVDIGVPPPAGVVKKSDTIVKGYFSVDGTNAVFFVETPIKGNFLPAQTVTVTKNPIEIFFDVARYAREIQGQPCYILGSRVDDELRLVWSISSVWPQGISKGHLSLQTVEECGVFIEMMLTYGGLEATPDVLLSRIFQDLQTVSLRPMALAYLSFRPNSFQQNRELERDILSIVGAYISSQELMDDWTLECLQPIWPLMPPSIMLPYFVKVAEKGGKQGELAYARVKNYPFGNKISNQENIAERVSEILPRLRTIDAQKNIHLFDSKNEYVSQSAGLVFSEIFDKPRITGKNTADEKTFWETEAGLSK